MVTALLTYLNRIIEISKDKCIQAMIITSSIDIYYVAHSVALKSVFKQIKTNMKDYQSAKKNTTSRFAKSLKLKAFMKKKVK